MKGPPATRGQAAFDYFMRLVSVLKERGTRCITSVPATNFPFVSRNPAAMEG